MTPPQGASASRPARSTGPTAPSHGDPAASGSDRAAAHAAAAGPGSDRPRAGAASLVRPRFRGVAMRVLVVEDEVDLAGALRQALEEDGYAVDVARDG